MSVDESFHADPLAHVGETVREILGTPTALDPQTLALVTRLVTPPPDFSSIFDEDPDPVYAPFEGGWELAVRTCRQRLSEAGISRLLVWVWTRREHDPHSSQLGQSALALPPDTEARRCFELLDTRDRVYQAMVDTLASLASPASAEHGPLLEQLMVLNREHSETVFALERLLDEPFEPRGASIPIPITSIPVSGVSSKAPSRASR